jgi:hypothetical protein
MRKGLGPLAWAALWTLLLPGPAIWMSALFTDRVLPYTVVTDIRRSIYVQDASAIPPQPRPWLEFRGTPPPPQLGNRSLHARITGRGVRYGQAASLQPVPATQLTLTPDALSPRGLGPLTVDLASGAWQYTDAAGKTLSGGGPFEPAVVEQYLADAGFKDAEANLQTRAANVYRLLHDLPLAPGNIDFLDDEPRRVWAQAALSRTSPQPIPWAGQAILVFWETVWLLGLLWIVRRHRRHG